MSMLQHEHMLVINNGKSYERDRGKYVFDLSSRISNRMCLTCLKLEQSGIDVNFLRLLIPSLTLQSSTLKELSLKRNKLSDDGLLILTRWIEEHSNGLLLSILDVSFNSISDVHVERFCTALQSLSDFQSLSIYGNHLTSKSGVFLARLISESRNFNSIDVWRNDLGPDGLTHISNSLCQLHPSSLTRLNIGANSLGDNGAFLLAKILMSSARIMVADVSLNNITDKGGASIATSLLINRSLVALDLRANDLTYFACNQLLDSAKAHPSLQCINLGRNNLTRTDCITIMSTAKEYSEMGFFPRVIVSSGAKRGDSMDSRDMSLSGTNIVFDNSVLNLSEIAAADSIVINEEISMVDKSTMVEEELVPVHDTESQCSIDTSMDVIPKVLEDLPAKLEASVTTDEVGTVDASTETEEQDVTDPDLQDRQTNTEPAYDIDPVNVQVNHTESQVVLETPNTESNIEEQEKPQTGEDTTVHEEKASEIEAIPDPQTEETIQENPTVEEHQETDAGTENQTDLPPNAEPETNETPKDAKETVAEPIIANSKLTPLVIPIKDQEEEKDDLDVICESLISDSMTPLSPRFFIENDSPPVSPNVVMAIRNKSRIQDIIDLDTLERARSKSNPVESVSSFNLSTERETLSDREVRGSSRKNRMRKVFKRIKRQLS